MTIREFKEHVKTRKLLDTEEIHQFMDIMSNEARRITFQLNTTYHTPYENCFQNCSVIVFPLHFVYFLRFTRISVRTLLLAKMCLSMPAATFKIMVGLQSVTVVRSGIM